MVSPEVADGKDGSGAPSVSTTVSIEEFNLLKTSMETRMDTLNELLTKLLEAQGASLPVTTLPLTPPPEGVSNEDAKENSGEHSSKTEIPPIKPPNGSGENERVPFMYSPDLPISHHLIHLKGAPPSLNESSFTNWQTSMRSHLNSASIALEKIIETGYEAVDTSQTYL